MFTCGGTSDSINDLIGTSDVCFRFLLLFMLLELLLGRAQTIRLHCLTFPCVIYSISVLGNSTHSLSMMPNVVNFTLLKPYQFHAYCYALKTFFPICWDCQIFCVKSSKLFILWPINQKCALIFEKWMLLVTINSLLDCYCCLEMFLQGKLHTR